MRVLVTGTSGRVGRKLVAALREAGHWVRGIDVAAAPPEEEEAPDDLILASLDDEEAVKRAVDGVEGVIHLAALMSWHPRDETRLFDVNVRGTFHLARHAAHHGVGRFVFASSGEVYPEVSPVRLPIDEHHPTLPTSVYGLTKLLGEEIVRSQHRRKGLPFCILRFAHTQAAEELLDPTSFFSGPRFYVNAKLRQLRDFPPSPAVEHSIAALEAVATDAEQHYVGCAPDGTPYRMGICDVRDMVSGLLLALEHPAAVGETFNIGPAGSFDFDEAVAHLARATGMDVAQVRLHTVAYRYDTSVEKAASLLEYTPRHSIFGMIDDAVESRDAARKDEAS